MALDRAVHHDDGPPRDTDPEASRQPVIAAQWALWGKEAHETGAHVLRCSTGPLRTKDFAEIITRYSPGDLDGLPQYTFSWIPDANREPEYVALGIHEFADPARADGRSQRDAAGRQIVYVRLFCVRYADLARVSVGYQDLFQAADQVELPRSAGGLIPLVLPAKPASSSKGPLRHLAERVAVLLLTGHPVCVVGADDESAAERLRFIDTAMAWLPYGLRATMSAGTWADSNSQDLKLRLFFAGVPRSPGLLADGQRSPGDWIVDWAGQRKTSVSGVIPQLYQGWLREVRDQAPMMLAEVTSPERFSPSSLRRLISTLPKDKGITETLDELARSLLVADSFATRTAVRRLERYVAGEPEIEPADLGKYRESIRVGNLLVDDRRLTAPLRGELYDCLIRLAFCPLTYRNYRAIEACAGGSLHAPLRTALGRCSRADLLLPWILLHYAPRSDKSLIKLHEYNVHPERPLAATVNEVAAGMLREDHAPVVFDFALRYLERFPSQDPPGAVLARYGFLTMEHEQMFADHQVRVERLTRVLNICFARKLGRPEIEWIYSQPGLRPTAALEDAVAAMTSGKNRGYLRQQAIAALRRSQGLRRETDPAGTRWTAPLRWVRPSYWRQDRGQPPASGPSQLLDAAASDEPGTAVATVPYEPGRPAGRRNRLLSRGSVWAHPKTTLTAFLLIVLILFLLFVFVMLITHPISR